LTAVFAAIMLTTAGTGFCPNYTLLGISTDRGCIASAIASAAAIGCWVPSAAVIVRVVVRWASRLACGQLALNPL